MTGSPLIVKPAAPASPVGSVMALDGWWPSIDYTDMREALRIGETCTHARLEGALETAAVTVLDDLAEWGAARRADGFTSLAAVAPAMVINGKPRLVTLFVGAVRYAAAALLAEFSTDFSATGSKESQAEAKQCLADYYEKLRLQNIRSILGATRVAVELI
ncbi:head completion/stabilization protein [Novosphingobium sp. KACC 22771]|uniref:head completion/stabilization protein n=1 Tax=Novosphingobium sp. KACC 22771 TaxID=3025670 RepID=UPI002365B036|nr:head completion/stabilization protein [Novosphingobium sp. KACC 22771]WDF71466.1 head completion/stabilization protein [Novosphingobium sp. KACC 22771]